MSFQPVLPFAGFAGWAFLNRTLAAQTEAFNAGTVLQNDVAYFRENIGSVETAEQLVDDRRLLRVALEAFGLGDDIDNKAFVQQILEGGTIDPDSLANKLSDSRYEAFSQAFGFGDLGIPNTQISTFADDIIADFQIRSFETAVGEQDEPMRLAMNMVRELEAIALDTEVSNETRWFDMMGLAPLRQVFETALGLPADFGKLDIDRQHEVFKERTEAVFGIRDLVEFADPALREDLAQRYLLMEQVNNGITMSSTEIALTLLS